MRIFVYGKKISELRKFPVCGFRKFRHRTDALLRQAAKKGSKETKYLKVLRNHHSPLGRPTTSVAVEMTVAIIENRQTLIAAMTDDY